ncbi:MAG: DNA topoisomerase, partial [Planctomycetes bacterium]|nr:DNA topoisomerase [Planctomycetota bacterium]
MSEAIGEVPLREAARQKYLNYALSVITARALPDVRDGLKPVQRRILYAMYSDLRLLPERKELKCAKVVGEVLGNYHPHGDSSVYDALVRMAQDFALRTPLVNGHGNFGSIDGDSAAAYRYTEAKLRPFAVTLLSEIGEETVSFRDTFDGMRQEPVVLPAQAPVLLVNGATGIAVGIATNIPPHNLQEVTQAAILLIDDPETSIAKLCTKIKGPDFPTGAQILNSKAELRNIYETGGGPVKMRGTWKVDGTGKSKQIVIDAIPYMVKKQDLVGKIRDLALDKKIPQILDVRDESTADIRVVLDLKADADPEMVMAYLYKSTDLQSNFNVNMTCLVPMEGTELAAPRKLDIKQMLRYFLDFRYETVVRRFEYELRKLRERIHILDGFAKIFNDLDRAIRIIRQSRDKKDAADGLMKAFDLDEIQTNAILEMMLYRIASLEISKILEERKEKRKRAREIEVLLA